MRILRIVPFLFSFCLYAQVPQPTTLSSGWQMQAGDNVPQHGAELSSPGFKPGDWYPATVPGTVLTTLVNNHVYPEPLYGENNRPSVIPDSLCRKDWWYRTVTEIPAGYAGKSIFLNFDGINYAADVWVNGADAGTINGAFIRGNFDITPLVTPGKPAAIAVHVYPQPHPGDPHEHTLGAGDGVNGGISQIDGPTFVCSMGWDWIPAIRDRNTGIWQKVTLSATGPVVIKDPQVTTDLPLPRTDSADITIATTLENRSTAAESGTLEAAFDDVVVEKAVQLPPASSQTVTLDPQSFHQLHAAHPKLWWPNGYGPQALHTLHLSFAADGQPSDAREVTFGIRKITYDVPGSDSLAFSVNGVRIFCRGGDWGMDEALKRIPRERLEAQIRFHQLANLNMIRNWGGQSTSDDFYDLCDRYGILVWDEFFQFNDASPLDLGLYLANVRDKVLRTRNHPCIALWCGRNEAYPPKYLDDAVRGIVTGLDPARWYQSNSGAGRGSASAGPYYWQTPIAYDLFSQQKFFNKLETFKTEIGAISIPTIESIQGMMPEKDWNVINDDWAEHDFDSGSGLNYPRIITSRYGAIANLADFVRKSQMMNYEGYRAMYEGREAQMFRPTEGVLTWMSHPAQPSFVWQLYHYDLDPNAALFAVQKACEQVHILFDEDKNGIIEVINNLPTPIHGAQASLVLYNLDGSIAGKSDYRVDAPGSAATTIATVAWPANLSPVHFLKLALRDSAGKLLSDNFYWRGSQPNPDDLTALDNLPIVTLDATATRRDTDGKCVIGLTLKNGGSHVALLTHLQLHRATSGDRVLPAFYSDNYLSLAPGEQSRVTIEAAVADLKGEPPLVLIDGWNIAVKPASGPVAVALNKNAQVDSSPRTGLPFAQPALFPEDEVHINLGGDARDGFREDPGYPFGGYASKPDAIDTFNVPHAAPADIYQTIRWGAGTYPFLLKPSHPGQTYTVRLHFAEYSENAPGKRVFDILINGKPALTGLDIFQEAGGKFKALVKDFPGITPDASHKITIALQAKTNTPGINAIEILKEPER